MQEFAEGLLVCLLEFIDGGRGFLVAREQVRTYGRHAGWGYGQLVVRRGCIAPRTKPCALSAILLVVAQGQEQKLPARKFE